MSALPAMTAKVLPGNALRKARALLSPLNLHWAGVGLLALVNLYLLAQMGFLWQTASRHNPDAIAQQRIALKTAGIAAQPLRGLDAKLCWPRKRRTSSRASAFPHPTPRWPPSWARSPNSRPCASRARSTPILRCLSARPTG